MTCLCSDNCVIILCESQYHRKGKSVNERTGFLWGDLPLTVPISDNRRADLACRLMYAIAASPDIRIASQDEEVFLTQDVLRIVDECGNVRVPEPDLEWFGTAEDN